MACYEYPIKCMNCGLHYTVWSWIDQWGEARMAYCPECGEQKPLMFPKMKRNKEIFEFVPGRALEVVKGDITITQGDDE